MYRTKARVVSGLLIIASFACWGCDNSKPQTIQDREIIMKARLEDPEAKKLYKEMKTGLLALLEDADKAFSKLSEGKI